MNVRDKEVKLEEGEAAVLRPRVVDVALLSLGRSPADFRISLLRFAFSRLRFASVSYGVVCGADPGSGLY